MKGRSLGVSKRYLLRIGKLLNIASLTVLLFLIAIMCVFSLTACTPNIDRQQDLNNKESEETNKKPVYGGTLNLATLPLDTYNPLFTKDIYTNDILSIIYEGIVKINENYKPVPALAESWDVSGNGNIWTLNLRKNIVWHDNMPFTADDVEFTLRALFNTNRDSIYKSNVEKIASFEVVDKYTIRIITSGAYSFLPERLSFPIIPKHIFADIYGNCRYDVAVPIGTGPYKYIEEDSKAVIMAVNNKWWGGTPYINSIIVKICKNYDEYINSIQVRESDFIRIERDDFNKFSNRVYLEIKEFSGKNFDFIAFNLSREPFTDKGLRQAISNGINKKRLIDYLLRGRVKETAIPLSPDSYLFSPDVTAYNSDGLSVRSLLSNSGWKDEQILWSKIQNGVRYTTEFELIVNQDNNTRVKFADEIALKLKEFGININVNKLSWEDFQQRIETGNFDMALMGWRLSNIPDLSFAYASNQAGGSNVSGYTNEKVDEILTHILTNADLEFRKDKMRELQAIVAEEAPIVGLYIMNDGIVFNKRIKGQITPHCNDVFANIAKWHIIVE